MEGAAGTSGGRIAQVEVEAEGVSREWRGGDRVLVQGSMSHKEETDFVPSVLEATGGFQAHVQCDLTCSLKALLGCWAENTWGRARSWETEMGELRGVVTQGT